MKSSGYFENESTTRTWNKYFNEVDKYLTKIGYTQGKTIRQELESHVYEAMLAYKSGSEQERLQKSLKELGKPEDIVPPMIAAILRDSAISSKNPWDVIRAAYYQIGHGLVNTLRSIAIGAMAAFSITLLVLAGLKPFLPEYVGLFTDYTGKITLGVLVGSENTQEHLGYGIIPVALISSFIFYRISLFLLDKSN